MNSNIQLKGRYVLIGIAIIVTSIIGASALYLNLPSDNSLVNKNQVANLSDRSFSIVYNVEASTPRAVQAVKLGDEFSRYQGKLYGIAQLGNDSTVQQINFDNLTPNTEYRLLSVTNSLPSHLDLGIIVKTKELGTSISAPDLAYGLVENIGGAGVITFNGEASSAIKENGSYQLDLNFITEKESLNFEIISETAVAAIKGSITGVSTKPLPKITLTTSSNPADSETPNLGNSISIISANAEQMTSALVGDNTFRVTAGAGINIRAESSTNSKVLSKLPNDSTVVVTSNAVVSQGISWLPVRLANGVNGYAASSYLTPAGGTTIIQERTAPSQQAGPNTQPDSSENSLGHNDIVNLSAPVQTPPIIIPEPPQVAASYIFTVQADVENNHPIANIAVPGPVIEYREENTKLSRFNYRPVSSSHPGLDIGPYQTSSTEFRDQRVFPAYAGTVVYARDGGVKGSGEDYNCSNPGNDKYLVNCYSEEQMGPIKHRNPACIKPGLDCGDVPMYGNMVILRHLEKTNRGEIKEFFTLYGHCRGGSVTVREGDTVYPAVIHEQDGKYTKDNNGNPVIDANKREICKIGSSGWSMRNHLHFECNTINRALDYSYGKLDLVRQDCIRSVLRTPVIHNPTIYVPIEQNISQNNSLPAGNLLNNISAAKLDQSGVFNISLNGANVAQANIVTNGSEVELVLFEDSNSNGSFDQGEQIIENQGSVELNRISDIEQYNLDPGWNLISMGLVPDAGIKASDIMKMWRVENANVIHMAKYSNGKFINYTQRIASDGQAVELGTDFDFNVGVTEGIFVYLDDSSATVSLTGKKVETSPELLLSVGWNLVGIPDAETNEYTAASLLDELIAKDIKATTVSDFRNSQYSSLVIDQGTKYGNDYRIIYKKGYFIRVESLSTR